MDGPHLFSVGELTRYLRYLLEDDANLSGLWVKGEISNLSIPRSGHIYFTLRDSESSIPCIMFRNQAQYLHFVPGDGAEVMAYGYVSVYEKGGRYQLYVQDIQTLGRGALYLAFEKLKQRLEEEGLFAEERKLALPFLPEKIGIVTSLTGAAIRDIVEIITRRFPNIQLILVPVMVQGEGAAQEIAEAIRMLNNYTEVDLIIVGRGGGSIEDLWAFNEEILARAIFTSRIPIISAVGHETDFTIADFVADKRAPTPSAAASLAIPEKAELETRIAELRLRLESAGLRMLKRKREHLRSVISDKVYWKSQARLDQLRQQLDETTSSMISTPQYKIAFKRRDFQSLIGKLEALSPLSILSRGYSLCFKLPERKLISSIEQIESGDHILNLIEDGEIVSVVDKVERGSKLP